MFLKVTPTRSGKTFLSFVQGYRDEFGKSKQKTIENIGWLDNLKKQYDDPISHFKKVAKQRNDEEINELIIKNLMTKTIDENSCTKNLGYVILKRIYEELNIPEFLRQKQKNLKIDFSLNDVFELLVYSRILYPDSKLSTYNNKDVFFEKFDFSLQDMYRSLDYFSDYKDDLLTLLWNNTKNKYNRDTSLTYYDTTNYYFLVKNIGKHLLFKWDY